MKNKPVIGIIGGGQLGRMFIEEALRYNIECIIVDADENAPAAVIADKYIIGSITEAAPLLDLANHSDVLTYEIEHIYIDALFEIEKTGKKIIPAPSILQIIQDKGLQKKFYVQHHIPTADFVIVNNPSEWREALLKKGWKKFAAKLCRDGYDGKGVQLMTADELSNEKNIPFKTQTVLEQLINVKKEIAVIVARDMKGNMKTFPIAEMEFDPNANLVKYLFSPAELSIEKMNKAEQIALDVVRAFNGAGLYAVEMMIDENENIFVNETAPRPHNSGHHTIEACYTSQYEQLLRILLNLPLGSTELIKPAAMINVLGDKNFTGEYYLGNQDKLLAIEGVYIHMYGKKISKPMRKLGHITILADTLSELKEKVKKVNDLIIIKDVSLQNSTT